MKPSLFTLFLLAGACSSTAAKIDLGNGDGGGGGGRGGTDAVAAVDVAQADATYGDAPDVSTPNYLPLCDGTQHLRLWVLVEPIFSRELPASQVRVENGEPFLTVDGTCSYWTNGGWVDDALSRDRGVRNGTLTASEAEMLEQSLSLDDIASLRDCTPVAGESDVNTREIAIATAAAQCPSRGARFDAAWSALETLAKTLWERGTPMAGALHVSAVTASDDSFSSPGAYAWPIAAPLGDFLLDPGKDGSNLMSPGVSRLVEDPESTTKLRALRDRYLADRDAQPGLYANWDGLKATDGGIDVLVYTRDAIPYEDTKGLLHF